MFFAFLPQGYPTKIIKVIKLEVVARDMVVALALTILSKTLRKIMYLASNLDKW